MSESVTIIIDAEDIASRKVETATRNVEQSVKRIKTAGEQTKKSIEFSGAFARALGGTEFGMFAQQIAQVTEKTSQFAEVSKLGGAGALAFKAGLVGVAGVIGFQLGKALGDIIFQTNKWVEALGEATAKSGELTNKLAEVTKYAAGLQKQEIQLLLLCPRHVRLCSTFLFFVDLCL